MCLLGWIGSFENGCGAGLSVDCTLMASNGHQSQASLMIFELWPPQMLLLQCHRASGTREFRCTNKTTVQIKTRISYKQIRPRQQQSERLTEMY